MKQFIIAVAYVFVSWLGTGAPASAQAPEEVALDAVRTRSSIPPDDAAIDNWITYRVNTLRENLTVGLNEADDNFLEAYRTQYDHPENSESFKTRFVEQTSRRFAAEFEKGRGLEVAVALALARALADMETTDAVPGLSAGLQAEGQPAVRYTCAKAFAGLIPSIQNDTASTRDTIARLRDAGVREPNGAVLKRIYEALFFGGANFDAAVGAILDVIKGQLQMRQQDAPACDGAEEVAYDFLRAELNNVSDKARLAPILAASLRLDVERYTTDGVSAREKYLIELTLDAAENLLARVVAPPAPAPSIRRALEKEDRDITMPLELNKWIGTPQTQGILNKPPWNVAVGAPVPK